MRHSLSMKINVIIVFVVAAILSTFGALELLQMRSNIEDDLNLSLSILSERAANTLQVPIWVLDEETMDIFIRTEMRDKNVYAMIIRNSYNDEIIVGKIRDQDWELRDVDETDVVSAFISQRLPIIRNDDELGTVQVYLTGKFMNEEIGRNARNTVIRTVVLLLLMATTLGVLIEVIVSRPLKGLTRSFEVITAGNLEQEIDTSRSDEIGSLAMSFAFMRDAIREKIADLNAEIRERRQAQAALQTLNAELDQRVIERTAELAQANEEISALNERLQDENMRMAAELDVTRQLQQMLLPTDEELRQVEGVDIAGFMEPADEVGGDYYDVLQHNGQVKIGMGDVTGHGLESGVVMLMLQTAVRTLLVSDERDPVRFMDVLNRTLHFNIQRIKVDKSLSLVLLDYQTGKLRLSGQHEHLIVVRQGGRVELLDTTDLGFPVGLVAGIKDFVGVTSVDLQRGDGIVLYSDGFTEAENEAGEFYGLERLCRVVSEHWAGGAEEVKEAVVRDARDFIGAQTVYDDLTLLVVKQT